MRTDKRIKPIARRNVHPKYENNIFAHEIPKAGVARSCKNILEGKSCKLVLFLTHWPLPDPGLAGALLWSRVAVVSTHHVLWTPQAVASDQMNRHWVSQTVPKICNNNKKKAPGKHCMRTWLMPEEQRVEVQGKAKIISGRKYVFLKILNVVRKILRDECHLVWKAD